MIKEIYLKELDLLNMKKPKAKKIMFHFLKDLEEINKLYIHRDKTHNKPENSLHYSKFPFYRNISDIYTTLTNDKEILNQVQIYKNTYDDMFVYVKRKIASYHSSSKFEEYLFFLNEENKIELNKNKITYLTANINSSYYNAFTPYKLSYSNSEKINSYVVEDNKIQSHESLISSKSDNEYYIIKHDHNPATNVFSLTHNNFQNGIEVSIEKMYTGNITLYVELDSVYSCFTVSEEGVFLDHSKTEKNTVAEIFELEFLYEDGKIPMDNNDSFVLDNYSEDLYKNYKDTLDLIMLEKDIYLSDNEKDFFYNNTMKIPEMYHFCKFISHSKQYNYNQILHTLLSLSEVAEKTYTKKNKI